MSNSKGMSQVIELLPKLTVAELERVKALAGQILGSKGTQVGSDNLIELFDVITKQASIGVPYSYLQKSRQYNKAWQEGAQIVVSFIKTTFPIVTRSKVTRLAISTSIIEILIDNLRGRKVPLTLGNIVFNLKHTPLLFEEAYPGYIKSGLVGMIYDSIVGLHNRGRKGR